MSETKEIKLTMPKASMNKLKKEFNALMVSHKMAGGVVICFTKEGQPLVGSCGKGEFCDVMSNLAQDIIDKLESGELNPDKFLIEKGDIYG